MWPVGFECRGKFEPLGCRPVYVGFIKANDVWRELDERRKGCGFLNGIVESAIYILENVSEISGGGW